MSRIALALSVIAAAGCAIAGRHVVRAPLESEGELLVTLHPLSGPNATPIELASIASVRADGEQPLDLLVRHAAAERVPAQRLLARGRLAPGAYSGIAVALATGAKGSAAQPVRVDVPFSIARGHATVVEVTAQYPVARADEEGEEDEVEGEGGAPDDTGAGAPPGPSFTAAVAPRLTPGAFGFCSSTSNDDLAGFDKDAREVTAVLPTRRSPWGLALDGSSNRLYVALADEDEIAVYDTGTGEEQSRIRLRLGDRPREVGLTPDRRLLVTANSGTNTASFIDTGAMIEVGRVAVGSEPSSVLVDRRGQRAYLFNAGSNSFSVVDVANRTLVATVGTDDQPLRGQLDRSGNRLYVAQARSPFLTVYSLPDLAVRGRVHVGLGTTGIKVDPATDLVFVGRSGDDRLSVYDPLALIPVDRIEIAEGATYFAIDDARNALFALSPRRGVVSVVDLTSRRPVARFDVGDDARVLAVLGERN